MTTTKKNIKKWIDKVSKTDKGEIERQVFITGHSLGSAYATYAAIDNASKVNAAFGFGAPKVSSIYAKQWEKLKDKLTLYHFNTPGDQLATFGQNRVGTATYLGTTSHKRSREETIGKIEDVAHKKLGRLVQLLTSVRPLSTSHRESYLTHEVTFWRVDKENGAEGPNLTTRMAQRLYQPSRLCMRIHRFIWGFTDKDRKFD